MRVNEIGRAVIGLSLVLLLYGIVFPGSADCAAKIYRLNLVGTYSEDHPLMLKVIQPWIKELEDKSEGQILVSFFNKDIFCPESEHLECVKKGQVGMAFQRIGADASKLPYAGVLSLPMAETNVEHITLACWELVRTSAAIQGEFSGIKVLGLFPDLPKQIVFKGDALSSPAIVPGKGSARGSMLVLSEPKSELFISHGMTAHTVSSSDVKHKFSEHGVQGALLDINDLRSYRLEQQISSLTLLNMYDEMFWFGMQEQSYRSLPPDLRKIIDDSTGLVLSLALGKAMEEVHQKELKDLKKSGIEIVEPSMDERKAWLEKYIEARHEGWIKALDKRGYRQGRLVLDRYLRFQEEAAGKKLN